MDKRYGVWGVGVACLLMGAAQTAPESKLAKAGAGGKLVYAPYNSQGDTLMDFSHCGYGGGGVPLPQNVPVRATLLPTSNGDDTARIQAAVDSVGRFAPTADGFRGAVLLSKGTYRVNGTVRIAQSGVIVRGAGSDEKTGTLLRATGNKPRALFEVQGTSALVALRGAPPVAVTDKYVPVGARTFRVANASAFHVSDGVIVRRKGNAAWIKTLGMDRITPRASDPASTKQWTPFSLDFDRVVQKVDGDRVTVDAPLACAIDERWGGGELVPASDAGRVERVGVESFHVVSDFDKTKTAQEKGKTYFSDEAHAEYVVRFDNVKHGWARNLSSQYLAHGIADLGRGAKWVTVEDCRTIDPVSVITGGRRYPYNSSGQLNLVQRCYARDARHAFTVGGGRVCGPNVFLDCKAEQNHATSEPHQRWSVGGLYDNVQADMAVQDRQWMGSGHGWAGANYVMWNCEGSLISQQPPTAQNFAIGFVGKKEKGAFARPDGWWESEGKHIAPRSLYRKQLEDRLGKKAVAFYRR